jgi:peptidoglycan/LPS O-acetylase OafA/YrhL
VVAVSGQPCAGRGCVRPARVYLLHPALIEVYGHLAWTSHRYSFWPQLLLDASFLAILLSVCSLTYLFVERPMQTAGRRLAR